MRKSLILVFLIIFFITLTGCDIKMVGIENIEAEYANHIKKIYDKEILEIDELIDVSVKFFKKIRVKGIEKGAYGDMLLFQYGVYNWGEGEFFYFDITRQFFLENDVDDEPYQLSLTLKIPPDFFKDVESYNSWSSDYNSLEKWIENIKSTQGYIKAKELNQINSFEIYFSKV